MDLIERMNATQKTVDLFKRKTLELGKVDCVQMMNAHRVHCGLKRLRIPAYGDFRSARRAMSEMGFSDLAQGMSKHYNPIHPSRVIMGDFIEMPGGEGFSALAVAVGNGNVIGFREGIDFADTLRPVMISGAWSIDG